MRTTRHRTVQSADCVIHGAQEKRTSLFRLPTCRCIELFFVFLLIYFFFMLHDYDFKTDIVVGIIVAGGIVEFLSQGVSNASPLRVHRLNMIIVPTARRSRGDYRVFTITLHRNRDDAGGIIAVHTGVLDGELQVLSDNGNRRALTKRRLESTSSYRKHGEIRIGNINVRTQSNE